MARARGSLPPSRRWAGAALATAAVAAGGCDWRHFDDLKASVPVLAVGPDSNFPASGDFGRYVLPLPGPAAGKTGGRYIVSAASTAAIGIVDVDAQGHASARSFTPQLFGTGITASPITSMAEVPGTRDILLGAPQANGPGSVYVMTMGDTLTAELLDTPDGEDHYGLAVGAGAFGGGAAPDYVVASLFQLSVYLDGDLTKVMVTPDSTDCPVEIVGLAQRERQNRAMLVAPLEGPGAPQIFLGTPAANGSMGAVSVFKVDPTTGAAVCDFAYRSGDARFGFALTTGDFDGDGTTDLLVGAPPGKAYWIKGPLTKGSALMPVTLAAGSSDLGWSVGAAALDDEPGDEALVGDPAAPVDGKMAAGEVRIVGSSAAGKVLDRERQVVRRHEPAASDALGVQARALPFCTASCAAAMPAAQPLLLLGSTPRTYVYFTVFPGDEDPRKP